MNNIYKRVRGVNMLHGIGASGGIGVGKVVLIQEQKLSYNKERIIEDKEKEIKRYQSAIEIFKDKTKRMAENIRERIGDKEARILEGHIMMIEDPFLLSEIETLIHQGKCAEVALETVCDMFVEMFSMTMDELTKQRITDVNDIRERVLKILLGIEEVKISSLPPNTILVARDLTPSMTAEINKENVVGILTEIGGKTSHSAILARALEIPAVLSIENIVSLTENEQDVILDGTNGVVIQNPTKHEVEEYQKKKNVFLQEKKELNLFIGKATMTADGNKVELVANIGKPEEATQVVDFDGEGVGLFRSEFLFMDRNKIPTEEEQFEAYKMAAETLKEKPVIIRTLDVGGDKEIPYLGLEKEENPFLGYRAVRFCLDREDVYKPQLRALLRASAFGNIKIMVPLVTCVDELRAVKKMVEEIKHELDIEGVKYNKNIPIGVMIETPAASLIADILAKEADFFSIGTNDLTQYTMAVDRGNSKVAYLYSVFNPAVLRSIERVIACGREEGIMVGMCGEAASDPLLIPLLLSFGLEEFSVNASSILATRKNIASWTKQDADKLKEKVMKLSTERDVVEFLNETINK